MPEAYSFGNHAAIIAARKVREHRLIAKGIIRNSSKWFKLLYRL